MTVSLIYAPEERERMLVKRAIWITMGRIGEPTEPISPELLHKVLRARHSPIRVLNFAFLLGDIPLEHRHASGAARARGALHQEPQE